PPMEKTSPPNPPTPTRRRRTVPGDERPPATERPAAPPRTPADIPGLGPIRVRALRKAGFESLRALQAADIAALQAVPGMSEITEEAPERAGRRMDRIGALLAEARLRDIRDRKAQARLAAEVAEATDRLAGSGTTDPADTLRKGDRSDA